LHPFTTTEEETMPAELRGSVYTTSRGFGIRWIEYGRRRYRSGFGSKKEAREWFTDEVRPRLNGRKREHSSSTLSEFSETWLQAHAADVEPTTITTLRYRLAHALDEFGDVPLASLQRQALEIAAWRARLPERLRYPATSAFRQAMNAAVAWGLIEINRVKKSGKNPQPKAREIRPLTGDDLHKITAELGEHAPLVVFAVETGLRPCEWLALERRDVDKSARRVYVEREHVEGVTKPYGKTTGSRRSVPLTQRALDALEALPPRIDSPLLFPATRGGYMHLRNWRRREWDTAIEAAGLAVGKCGHLSGECSCEEFARSVLSPSPYVLRHTFASNALAAGVGTFELARYMGTSVEMIERTYGHLVEGADDLFRSRLETLASQRSGVEVASTSEAGS
jgi:integrase